jgi:inner membrane protein
MLTVLMLATRKVDWYALSAGNPRMPEPVSPEVAPSV